MLDGLNMLYDSKMGGTIPTTIMSDTLDRINKIFVSQCKKGIHTEEEIESYKAELISDTKIFSTNHIGLAKSTALLNETLRVNINVEERAKVM